MFDNLINEFNNVLNDDRFHIYDVTNNNTEAKQKYLVEGVFRTTSGLITRTNDEENIITYNFKIDFAVPVDNYEFRQEAEFVLKKFRKNIDDKIFNNNIRVHTSVEVAFGTEYSYKNNAQKFHDYVTYYIIGTLDFIGSFVGMENTTLKINNIDILGFNLTFSLSNILTKNSVRSDEELDTNNQYDTEEYGRIYTINVQASNNEGCKFLYDLFNNPFKVKNTFDFKYVWYDNDLNELINIESKIKINSIDINNSYGFITGIVVRCVDTYESD